MRKLGVLAATAVLVVSCLAADKKPPRQPTPEENEAYKLTKNWLTQTLKAPLTAHFQPIEEIQFSTSEQNTTNLAIYVDAQNSYGAMIRTRFHCNVGPMRPDRLYRVRCTRLPEP